MQKMHIANSDKPVVFYSLELEQNAVVAIFTTTAADGKTFLKTGALEESATVAKIATVQKEEKREVTRSRNYE